MDSTLTNDDIAEITNIVTQHGQKDESRVKQFSGQPKDAVSFFEDFEYYANANGWDDNRKRVKLGTYLTNSAREWYSVDIEGTEKTWAQVKEAFHTQYLPIGYEQYLRREFLTRKQNLYETSANFIISMRALLKKSNQTMTETQAVDIILSNMTPQIAERVIPMDPRTFAELKTFATRIEQAMKAAFESRNTSD